MIKEKIELNRRFVPFSKGPTGLHVGAYLQVMQELDKGATWEELLESKWIVILGEAGTGKSTEFKLRPRILRDQGAQAFSMDITTLALDGAEQAVAIDELELLRAWREGEGEGTFFLDSVSLGWNHGFVTRTESRRFVGGPAALFFDSPQQRLEADWVERAHLCPLIRPQLNLEYSAQRLDRGD